MSKIQIDEIYFENYRQYGTQRIKINHDKPHDLIVFIAKNGYGKTTLLNAITWCLYGDEKMISDKDRALSLINTSVISEMTGRNQVNVVVRLSIKDDENFIVFERSQRFIVDKEKNPIQITPDASSLMAQISKINSIENPDTKYGDEANLVVNRYFSPSIYDFYFFDGENLQNYFDEERSEKIRDAIYELSQITLLNRTIDRIRTKEKELTRQLTKQFPDTDNLFEKQEQVWKSIEKCNEMLREAKAEKSRRRDEIDRINTRLQEIKPIQDLHARRMELEKQEDDIEKRQKDAQIRLSEFIRNYTIYLNVYPSAKRTLDIIIKKQEAGELPPKIDTDMVKRLLEHPEDKCPICEGEVTETAREHLLRILEENNVSSNTSAQLNKIMGSLQNIVEATESYPQEKEKIMSEIRDLELQYKVIDKELIGLSKTLSQYSETSGKAEYLDLEKRRNIAMDAHSAADRTIGTMETNIQNKTSEAKELKKEIDDALSKQKVSRKLTMERDMFRKLYDNFMNIKNNITDKMRKDIERITEDNFLEMSSKRRTFSHVQIDDDYTISVTETNNLEMAGSLSATEKMALAYAFTIAIHNASGKNCPLVIDSPLGRVSDDNREYMARVLLKTSLDKQIIMLFTPDEYSENVRKVYDGLVSVYQLNLDSDEKHVYVKGENNGI